jgi:transcriptional regulator
MYLPRHFEESRVEVLHEVMRARPLASVVTLHDSGMQANHLPLLLTLNHDNTCTLSGHCSRANGMWKEAFASPEVLSIFHGPQAYVSPSWLPSKLEDGRAVPSWNYAVVHAYGTLTWHEDPDWLRSHLRAQSERHEAQFAEPWRFDDAPVGYTDALLRAIVGFELRIVRLSGKWKMSQNHPERNQRGVIAGLRDMGGADADEVADMMARACDAKFGAGTAD